MNSFQTIRLAALGVALVSATALVACSDTTAQGTGTLQLQLTDAPFSSDSVSRVDVYVVRVDAKAAETASAEMADGTSDTDAMTSEWTTVVTPDRLIELLALRNGITTTLGESKIAAGSYRSFRLVIDPSKSSVTLKNGTVLTSGSTPNVSFPSAARSGIKVKLDRPITIAADGTTLAVVDFDVSQSFVLRGNTIAESGLIFKPVIRGTTR